MSSGKYSGFSDIAKQAMMQPQESMLEVKNKKNQLYIGIPKETSFQENRIALTPLSVALLVNNGHQVMLEILVYFFFMAIWVLVKLRLLNLYVASWGVMM